MTKNPLVILSGIWEQKRGRMILRCRGGTRPKVPGRKLLAYCDASSGAWVIEPSPATFNSMQMCKDKKFLKPAKINSLKPLKYNKNKNKG